MLVVVERYVHVDLQRIDEEEVSEDERLLERAAADADFLQHALAQNPRGHKVLERGSQPNLGEVVR